MIKYKCKGSFIIDTMTEVKYPIEFNSSGDWHKLLYVSSVIGGVKYVALSREGILNLINFTPSEVPQSELRYWSVKVNEHNHLEVHSECLDCLTRLAIVVKDQVLAFDRNKQVMYLDMSVEGLQAVINSEFNPNIVKLNVVK